MEGNIRRELIRENYELKRNNNILKDKYHKAMIKKDYKSKKLKQLLDLVSKAIENFNEDDKI
jgi:hypothetical protein